MARQTTTPRTRKYEPHPARATSQYEARRPELRPVPAGGAPGEPRLGPYEFRYPVEHGYTSQERIV